MWAKRIPDLSRFSFSLHCCHCLIISFHSVSVPPITALLLSLYETSTVNTQRTRGLYKHTVHIGLNTVYIGCCIGQVVAAGFAGVPSNILAPGFRFYHLTQIPLFQLWLCGRSFLTK